MDRVAVLPLLVLLLLVVLTGVYKWHHHDLYHHNQHHHNQRHHDLYHHNPHHHNPHHHNPPPNHARGSTASTSPTQVRLHLPSHADQTEVIPFGHSFDLSQNETNKELLANVASLCVDEDSLVTHTLTAVASFCTLCKEKTCAGRIFLDVSDILADDVGLCSLFHVDRAADCALRAPADAPPQHERCPLHDSPS